MYIARVSIEKDFYYSNRLDNPNSHKGLIWKLFESHNLPYNSGGWLYRTDINDEKFYFFIMSKFKPETEYMTTRGIKTDIKYIPDDTFKEGNIYYYRCRVNPVTNRCINGKSKRFPKKNEDVPDWFLKQTTGAAECICKVENTYAQRSYKQGQIITHHCAEVSGTMKVKDNNKFVEMMYNGVGRAKRYGFGLIALSAK
jgi:CRISPR-associated protein Cas6/Cse3/CasE subtype I-E